jgi:hypothetical protein
LLLRLRTLQLLHPEEVTEQNRLQFLVAYRGFAIPVLPDAIAGDGSEFALFTITYFLRNTGLPPHFMNSGFRRTLSGVAGGVQILMQFDTVVECKALAVLGPPIQSAADSARTYFRPALVIVADD